MTASFTCLPEQRLQWNIYAFVDNFAFSHTSLIEAMFSFALSSLVARSNRNRKQCHMNRITLVLVHFHLRTYGFTSILVQWRSFFVSQHQYTTVT